MEPPKVDKATRDRKSALIEVLLIAFSTDPIARFGMPRADQYLNGMRIVFDAFATEAVAAGGAWLCEDIGGGALWMPPGRKPSEESFAQTASYVEPTRMENFFQLLDKMDAAHPTEPHWYLGFIGVDVARQGEGLGSAMLKASLRDIDAQSGLAYLESSNPRNLPLYERFGFEVTQEIQVGDSPVVHAMVRPIGGGS